MNPYLNDDEQVEQIKEWWKKYGFSIVTGIVLGLALMYGMQFWNSKTQAELEASSASYQELLVYSEKGEQEQVNKLAAMLIEEHAKTPYSDLAHFMLAKDLIAKQDYSKAQKHYAAVIKQGHVAQFKTIARIRSARLLAATGKFDQALDQLANVDDEAFTALVNEIKGDILLAQKHPQMAIEAYKQALSLDQNLIRLRPMLRMKINNLEHASLADPNKNKA